MKIYRSINEAPEIVKPIVTVGTFDGVHLGHNAILSVLVEEAKKNNTSAVVVTFYPHPRLVLSSDGSDIRLINSRDQKIKLLEKIGVDYLFEIPFTRAFSQISSDEFVKTFLVDRLDVGLLIIGYDHQFGKNRQGDQSQIFELAKKYNFSTKRVEAHQVDDSKISSTIIRKALKRGDISKANSLLGYEYSICGTVIHGNKNGRKIGFPTANIAITNRFKLIVANGVYAAKVSYNGKVFQGMVNVGFRPTIIDNSYSVEVHLFDFSKEIYGEEIEIHFVSRIRDEIRFSSMEKLKTQLEKDMIEIKTRNNYL